VSFWASNILLSKKQRPITEEEDIGDIPPGLAGKANYGSAPRVSRARLDGSHQSCGHADLARRKRPPPLAALGWPLPLPGWPLPQQGWLPDAPVYD
jgi:hypothetical protein